MLAYDIVTISPFISCATATIIITRQSGTEVILWLVLAIGLTKECNNCNCSSGVEIELLKWQKYVGSI